MLSFSSKIPDALIKLKIIGIANKEPGPNFKIKALIIGISYIKGKLTNFIIVKSHNLLNFLFCNLGKDTNRTLFLNILFIVCIINFLFLYVLKF